MAVKGKRSKELFPGSEREEAKTEAYVDVDSGVSNSKPASEPGVPYLRIRLTRDNKIDWEGMRTSYAAKCREVLSQPEVLKQIAPESAAPVEVFDPDFCAKLYDGLGRIQSFLTSLATKIPSRLCDAHLLFTPEECDALAQPTAKVLDKYGPEWLIQYKDEVALVVIFAGIEARKFRGLILEVKSLVASGHLVHGPNGREAQPEVSADSATDYDGRIDRPDLRPGNN